MAQAPGEPAGPSSYIRRPPFDGTPHYELAEHPFHPHSDHFRGATHGWAAVITGDGGTVGVDGHYLRQGVDALTAPMIKLCLFEGRKRGLFLLLPLDEHGDPVPGFRHVVMAKRVMAGDAATAAA